MDGGPNANATNGYGHECVYGASYGHSMEYDKHHHIASDNNLRHNNTRPKRLDLANNENWIRRRMGVDNYYIRAGDGWQCGADWLISESVKC